MSKKKSVWWKNKEDALVYFMQEPFSRCIKIGSSINPCKRMAGLNRSNPYGLVLLGYMYGGFKREKWFHNELKKYRIQGEWFSSSIANYAMTAIVNGGCPELGVMLADVEDDAIEENRLASLCGVTPVEIKKWCKKKNGIKPLIASGMVFYKRIDVQRYICKFIHTNSVEEYTALAKLLAEKLSQEKLLF